MEIRRYEQRYCNEMIKLFYDTVHYINAKDYSKEQYQFGQLEMRILMTGIYHF